MVTGYQVIDSHHLRIFVLVITKNKTQYKTNRLVSNFPAECLSIPICVIRVSAP